ncbi:MAG: hypothetical protein KQH57_14090 [Actinomycetales bacterium]|nr:hypothetical protein [Actinomycetales bacterium]
MRLRTKIGAGVAGSAIVIAAALGTAGAASAATTDGDISTPSWCDGTGAGGGMRGWSNDGTAGRFGVSAVADYLADKLGVSADDVSAALVAYHADNPVTERGRDLSDADLAERRAAEATYLADALDVDVAKVTAALESFATDRQAERTAALEDMLAERVDAGTLTQSEADAILAAHVAGDPIGLGGQGMGGRGMGPGGHGGGHGRMAP